MTMLLGASRMLVGLFVDDGSLALAILVIVLLSWIFSTLMPDISLAAGAMLLVGCLAVLFANVMKAARGDIIIGSGFSKARRLLWVISGRGSNASRVGNSLESGREQRRR